MIFDYYASLKKENQTCPSNVDATGLAAGFVDECLVWSCQDKKPNDKKSDPKNEARTCYMKRAHALTLKIPSDIRLEPDFSALPDSSWFALEINFTLQSPWYSKDDRPFHVLDNPVRKDRVFGVPFMSAASWKGLLRWACRMQEGLFQHLETHTLQMEDWNDPAWITHLFGNERDQQEDFQSGALVFYPTWFDKVGFEVINPHDRSTRAGTQPIYYEVVPVGTQGTLRLLYAPQPGEIAIQPGDFLDKLLDSIKELLETYGISAKRTAGWGAARITNWTGILKNSAHPVKKEKFRSMKINNFHGLSLLSSQSSPRFSKKTIKEFKKEMKQRVSQQGGTQ